MFTCHNQALFGNADSEKKAARHIQANSRYCKECFPTSPLGFLENSIHYCATASRAENNVLCYTVMYLTIGTPKIINFHLFQMENCFRCPKIWAHYNLIIICLHMGTPKTIIYHFGTNGKVMVLDVPILKHNGTSFLIEPLKDFYN